MALVALHVSTFVIMPVRNHWQLTRQMLHSLDADQVDDVLVLDNGSEDDTARTIRSWQRQGRYAQFYPLGQKMHRANCAGLSVYEMWNRGFARARKLAGHTLLDLARPGRYEQFYVLVTNNDITLPRGAINQLRAALRGDPGLWATYPDYDAPWMPDVTQTLPAVRYTHGVLSSGGMFGACFMLAGHRIPWTPLITDPAYQHWYGDDHLAECIEQEGGGQARLVGLPVQHVNEATARDYPNLYHAKLADRGRWLTRESRGARAVERTGA